MRVIVCLVLIHSLIINEIATEKAGDKSGPYRIYGLKLSNNCKRTSLPLDEDPPIRFNSEIYYTNSKDALLRGNITVFRENWTFKPKIKSYIWSNGKWKLTYVVHGVACNTLFTDIVMKTFNLRFNRGKCVIEKGDYHYENYDMNVIHHLLISKMEYGRTLWRVEAMSPTTTYHCNEVETAVVPA